MLPRDLRAEQFAAYPPLGRALVLSHLELIRGLPPAYVPALLREVIDYDLRFPAERRTVERQLIYLGGLPQRQRDDLFAAFDRLSLPPGLLAFDWVNQPEEFTEQLSATLWSTRQLDQFRSAATELGDRLGAALPPEPIPAPRLGIAVIGQGVESWDAPLFRRLRPHGTCFDNIRPDGGLELLLAAAAGRARSHPVPYGHWYVDGGAALASGPGVIPFSWQATGPMRSALLGYMETELRRPGMGPEELRTRLARLRPADLGIPGSSGAADPVLDQFALRILTEGSGTQIFATTFAQWTAREILRRAQPLTLMVRFAPRQRQRPMNELLSSAADGQIDPEGSLVDAEMGAYYQWINQARLPGADRSIFLAWFEGHGQALVVSPTLPRGATSGSALDLGQLLALATG